MAIKHRLQHFTNSRYVILVGDVDKEGFHALYSTPGPYLFIVAPGGSKDTPPNHVVTNKGGGLFRCYGRTERRWQLLSYVVSLH